MAFLFFIMKVAVTFVIFWNHFKVHALVQNTANLPRISCKSPLQAFDFVGKGGSRPLFASSSGRGMGGGGGAGMGMGGSSSATTKSKKQSGSKNKNLNKVSSTGTTPFDVNASLLRMGKKYDELTREAAKKIQNDDDDDDNNRSSTTGSVEMLTSEYVIAARASSKKAILPDWVPIAQLCLKRPESEYHEGAADAMVQMAISVCCRELSHVAASGAPVFATIARNELQYSVESIDSFHKFVYDDVMKGKSKQNTDDSMTKAIARQTLGLIAADGETTSSAAEISKTDIKQAYRKLSFELHPDRFVGTAEECEDAKVRFGKVQLAYETLTSGVRASEGGGLSWYESLGGRARTGFVGPIQLVSLSAAQEHLQRHGAETAIAGLDPTMVQSFVARNLRSE
jgi:hypothetical protein